MDFVFLLAGIFLVARWLIVTILKGNNTTSSKIPPTVIKNYKTENHLHISKEDLEKLIK